MRRLVFVDDDDEELKNMAKLVEGKYDYLPLHWPKQRPENLVGEPPDIFVLDLYLPPGHREARAEIPAEEREAQAEVAHELAKRFEGLYGSVDKDKALLQATMKTIQGAYNLLKRQWEALEQSPDNGLQLLRELRAHPRYGGVPVVFYSRKITPEDVVRVLQAGAVDAIRKGYPGDDPEAQRSWLLPRLDRAQNVHRLVGTPGFNVNTTLFPEIDKH